MIKTISELKEYILWCKEHKIKTSSIQGVTFEISELAFIDSLKPEKDYEENFAVHAEESKLEAEQQDKEDEDLLFWSSNN